MNLDPKPLQAPRRSPSHSDLAATVLELLEGGAPVVAICGSGGSGKTRLARRVARVRAERGQPVQLV